MTDDPTRGPQPAAARTTGRAQGLRAAATRGTAWTSLLTLGTRALQFGSQIVLAWLLSPAAFGLIGTAYSVAAFAWFIRHAGIGVVLIQRQRRFDRWANPAAWLSLTTGLIAAVGLAVAAPFATVFFDKPLTLIILILAAAIPFEALQIVPHSKLLADLKFKRFFFLEGGHVLFQTVLAIVLAMSGFWALSFVLPRLIGSVFYLPVMWAASGARFKPRPEFHHWKYLLSGITWITAGGLIIQVINQGDYIVLGRYLSEEVVGAYYLAFVISSQTMMLITINFGGVLLPTLSKLRGDLPRQNRAFLDVCKLIATFGLPVCLSLAVVAEPLIEVVFDNRYETAATYLRWLAIGMGFRLVAHNANFYLQATGQWKKYFVLNCVNAAAFLLACWVGVKLGGAAGVAVGVSVFFALYGYGHITASLAPGTEGRFTAALKVFAQPVAITGLAAALAWGATTPIPMPPVVRLLVAGPLVIALSALFIRLFDRPTYEEILRRLTQVLRRKAA